MDYLDWLEKNGYPHVSFTEAVAEYRKHGFTADDLIDSLGESIGYSAQDVLESLGY